MLVFIMCNLTINYAQGSLKCEVHLSKDTLHVADKLVDVPAQKICLTIYMGPKIFVSQFKRVRKDLSHS